MPRISTKAMTTALADNNIGAIQPSNIRDVVSSNVTSSVIEAFDPYPAQGYDLTFNSTYWAKATLGSLTDLTTTPAYSWIRDKVLASAQSGARYFSQVDGEFQVTADTHGYLYSPASNSLGVICDLEVGWYGAVSTATMFGALVVYKTASGSSFGTNTTRHMVVPFDTGASGSGPYPVYCRDKTTIVLMPGESVRVRLEYYGTSGGAAVTPTISKVTVFQFMTSLVSRGSFQPYADAASTEPNPSSGSRMANYSDIWGKSFGVPLANRSGLT